MASLLYVASAKKPGTNLAAIHCELTLPGRGVSVLNRIVSVRSGRELTKCKLSTILQMLENGTVDENGMIHRVPANTEIRLCTSDQYLVSCIQTYFEAQMLPEESRAQRYRNGRECKRLWNALQARNNTMSFDTHALLSKTMQSEAFEYLKSQTGG